MAGKIGLTFLDYSNEQSRVDIYTENVGVGNIADLTTQSDHAQAGSLAARIAALSLCTPAAHSLTALTAQDSNAIPASQYAQRESGLLVTYSDSVNGRLYRITIPGPDLANLAVSGSDAVNTTAQAWIDFVSSFESKARSIDGNNVTVVSGRFVGRNR